MHRALFYFCALAPVSAGGHLLEANRGQFPSGVIFLARNGAISTAVSASGLVFRAHHDTASASRHPLKATLERHFRPLGYSCVGGSGTFTLRRRTAANHLVEVFLDVGTYGHAETK